MVKNICLLILVFIVGAQAKASSNSFFSLVVSSDYRTSNGETITISGTGMVVTDRDIHGYNQGAYRSVLRYQQAQARQVGGNPKDADSFETVARELDQYGKQLGTNDPMKELLASEAESKLHQDWCDECRYFVLTASHISQGENTRITIDGRQQRIIGRYADLVRDVEVLEIQNNVYLRPQVFFNNKLNAFDSNFYRQDDGVYKDWRNDALYQGVKITGGESVDAFVILPTENVTEAPKTIANQKPFQLVPQSWLHNGYNEIMVNAWLPPGLSGASMYVNLQIGQQLGGLVTEYDRELQYSWIPWDGTLLQVFRAYLNNSRGKASDHGLTWSWQDNGLTTYRIAHDSQGRIRIKETELIRGNAGHGSHGDGGHGTGGDGGHGSRGDGGPDLDRENPNLSKELSDGLWIDQRQVFAFTLTDGSSVFADVQSYSLLNSKIKRLVVWGSDLLDLFKAKLAKRFTQNDLAKYSEFSGALSVSTPLISYTKQVRATPIVKYRLEGDSIRLNIDDRSFGDHATLLVRSDGGVGTNPYQRLVKVKSDKNAIYVVDVTGLFVNDYKTVDISSEIIKRNAPYVFVNRENETRRYISPVIDE